MPEGPANGRVEAKRRALTMSSTAPASSARWWSTQFEHENESCSSGGIRLVREPIATPFACPLLPSQAMPERAHAGGAILLHGMGAETRTRDTSNDGVNDPVRAPWGQAPGTAAGSFTPSLVQ